MKIIRMQNSETKNNKRKGKLNGEQRKKTKKICKKKENR